MTPERWQQVNDLFQSVADRTPNERRAFLQTACQGDEALRREVESLITSHDSAQNFIESPAFEVAPELLASKRPGAIKGELIGRYRIESLIGAGGMGEVYLARDEELGRKVALKFLPERLTADKTQLSRFKSEARTASALNHPNILTVYEIGTDGKRHFIATEFIEGETLSGSLLAGRMSVQEALDIAMQVASALDAAHNAGVVHRDIKPDNIMLRPDGYVKLLDFGIAKLTQPRSASDAQDIGVTSTQLTQAGLVLGTLRYMSPEQRRGQPADARSDIWSLGVVFYEMLGGIPPFAGPIVTDDIASIWKTNPTAPIELQSILRKALCTDRDDRYQTIAEMLAELRALKGTLEHEAAAPKTKTAWLWKIAIAAIVVAGLAALFLMRYRGLPAIARAPALPAQTQIPEKSIAVLPFENRSRDPDNAYFADAIQDEILTRLSKIADLKVISRTSTEHYKNAPANVPDIAKQLGVAHILEGSVQKSGDGVRVNVQLIKAVNDSHVWADTFDRKLTDILSVESEVAKAIADQLGAKLTGQEEQIIAAKPTDNPEAYDAYLRGLAYSLKTANTTANALNAQKYLKEAVRLDPKFALAWALLSFVNARGYRTQFLQPTVALRDEAWQAAETALNLQSNLGEAILAKGFYYYACLKDYDTAVRHFEKARPLMPNSSRIPELLAYVTRKQGQWDQSESYFNEAEQLDPRNVSLLTQHALSYKDRRLFPEAWRKFEQILNITPDDADTIVEKAVIAQAEGDLPRASALLASVQPAADDTNALETQAYQSILERQPAQIISRLKELLTKPDPALGFYVGELRFWLGWTQDIAGDHAAAQESWREARSELESFQKEQPENHILLGDLALVNVSLGDKAAALTLSERGMTVNPVEKDALVGPASIEFFARVAAQTRETDRAIAALQKLLSIPYSGPLGPGAPLTRALLRLDPMFDPLRSDPRFEKLVEEAKEAVATAVPAKSIAVLPFENLSRDPDNAYFAEGIQDEILTRLSKIADLKVISRTSTRQYKSTPANVPDIAKQLRVAHILEGSVQKSGDAVRVNVQLIKAANDSHVWADTFDRKLTDTFSVESEVAKAIADQLGAKLTGQEEQVIAAKPTDNPEAYDAYLRGLAYTLKPANTTANALGAQKYLREAVRLDPKFARAWALLSTVDSVGYLTKTLQSTVALRDEARQAAEAALSLRPGLGEALMAKGYYHYGCLKDYDTAIRYFEQARQILPNDSRIPESLAYVTRRRGQWERSETYFNEAERLDPRNGNLLTQHAVSLMRLRSFPEALRKLDEVLNITPDDVRTVAFKAGIAQAEGDLPRAAALLAPLHPNADDAGTLETQVYQAILERQPASIIPRLEAILAKPDPELGYFNSDLRYWLGWAQDLAGDHVAAQKSWRQARSELELFLKDQPENFNVLTDLALTNMGLGDKGAALAFAERAIAANPIEKDAISGPSGIETLARVAAQMGEPDRAIAALQKLLSIPAVTDTAAPFTPALLRLDPMFDPLRNDSRFQELVASTGTPSSPPEQIPEKSIAVLPFENQSSDPENAFFSDGVQDEILSNLARVADLKVISRTSVMQYKTGAKRNLRQIGNELGVAHVVEGGVQRVGNRVRVNAQLIDARTDAHLWAQTYDRDLADVFAIQSEIAKTIADQLQAKLSPNEKRAIEQAPTTDITAFNLYSRAKPLLERSLLSDAKATLLQAVDLLNQAVAQDPAYFDAYCQLAYAHDVIYFAGYDHTPARLAQAEAAIQTAFRLRPDAGESHLARAWNLYWGYRDYDGALGELEIARQTLPNNPGVFFLKGVIDRRQGRFEDSIRNLERAYDLDPRKTFTLQQTALTYFLLKRYHDEIAVLDRALAIAPNDAFSQVERTLVELHWHANTRPLHETIDSIQAANPAAVPKIADVWLLCALAERDSAAAKNALSAKGENPIEIDSANVWFTREFIEGVIARMSNDLSIAREAFLAARTKQEKIIQAQPNYGPAWCVLGLIDAGLGRKQDALREGRRAVELLPVENDAINGLAMIKYFAVIAAWSGDKDLACEQLAIAARVPNTLSYGQLKLLPFWDPLRGDPRFEKIVDEAKEPVTQQSIPTTVPAKSIAVLPFENRSSDPENAFFTDGVQDEILTDLARVADLKVISRTSVMQYKTGAKRNLREIANELGVAHILEGSVQRTGNRVRVNAQLIDARTDTHLWAQTYDRDLADVFAIQSEIAQTIADQLQAKLSPSEKSAIERPPTTDIAAFDLYSHAKNIFLKAFAGANARTDLLQAADLLRQAVARDPSFFQAYCQLAFTEINIYGVLDPNPAYLTEAEAALQAASRLRPDAGETHLARARNLYWGHLDYDGALRELEVARRSLPGEDWVFSLKGYIERRQGRWEECIRDLERATELDPRNVLTLQQLALTYQQLRRYAEEKSTYERILAFEPDDPITKSQHAFVELDSKADTRPLHEVTDSIRDKNPAAVSSIADDWLLCALAERDPAAATKALIALGENQASLAPIADVRFNRSFMKGLIARLAKDDAKAKAAFTAARAEQEKVIHAQLDYAPAVCVLGLIDAALGRKQEALQEGRRAVELLPLAKDALRGIAMVKYLAMIAAWVGDKDLAFEQLAIAVRHPSDLSYGQLKLMPFWDPLRGDSRFEGLVEEVKKPVALSATDARSAANLAPAPEKSIAVLPFENRSSDPNNAYFADGIQDEILTRLSKIADLKVISRTSTQHYKSAPTNLPDIARQLGVAHIVEGSVQKSGDAVRVNVQLIKAATDSHLWADTFDRKLIDIFSVESEVAKAIADQLQAKLTGREEQVIAVKSTDNTDAYDAYLRGLAYTLKPLTTANALGAQKHLREAVRLDPKFAHAWALLSYTDALGYIGLTLQPTVALREEARQAAETALTLLPNLGEAMLAKGQYNYGCLKDYDAAVRYFEQARPLLPNDSRIPRSLASVTRRQGQWDRHESYLNEAERLDPRNVILLAQHALSYSFLRRFPEAKQKLDQVLEITPGDADALTIKAAIAQAEGDLPAAAALLSPLRRSADPAALEQQVYQAILERRPAQIITRLKEVLAKPDPALGYFNGELRFYLGWAQEVDGDHAAAQKSWRQARSELEALLTEQPDNHNLFADLALTNMGLGDKAAAFAFVDKGIALVPIEKDAIDGTIPIEILARVAAKMGEPGRAIAALQKLLVTPGSGADGIPLTPALLRLDPMFDPLRNDPRFQKLVASEGPSRTGN